MRYLLIVTFIITCNSLFSQTEEVTYMRKNFIAASGYYVVSGESFNIDSLFFKKLINNDKYPAVSLSSYHYLTKMAFFYNRYYFNLNVTYDYKKEKEKDSLISYLNESSYGLDVGFNIVKNRWMILSPYTGIRLNKYKHITTNIVKQMSIDDYIQSKELKLKVYQFSCPVGINAAFYYGKSLSFGLYSAYRFKINSKPIIRTYKQKIQSDIKSPLGNFIFGMGMGLGFKD